MVTKLNRWAEYLIQLPNNELENITNEIHRLEPGRGPGEEGIPLKIYKMCLPVVTKPLHILFRLIWESKEYHPTGSSRFFCPFLKRQKERRHFVECGRKSFCSVWSESPRRIKTSTHSAQAGSLPTRQWLHRPNIYASVGSRNTHTTSNTRPPQSFIEFRGAFGSVDW